MAKIFRVVTEWQAMRGGPGYTNMFFRNVIPGGAPTDIDDRASALAARERVEVFWRRFVTLVPNDVTIVISNTVDALEDTTGELLESYVVGDPETIPMGDSGFYSAASGGVITWTTASIRNGRRIRGRTFIVPLAGSAFTTSGRLDPFTVRTMQEAGNDLAIGGLNSTFGVWARPTSSGAADGRWAEAAGVRTTDLPAVLRSRRD